jgi:catechol 2,3-dioxygenase-like lactoylglutathione lyase family enzyme
MSDDQGDSGSPIIGFFHGGVSVSDLERSLTFYVDLLGLEVAAQRDATDQYLRDIHGLPFRQVRMAFLRVPDSDTMVELLEYQGVARHRPPYQPSDPGTGHLCFFVADVAAIHRQLTAAGYPARSREPVEITAGPNKGARVIYTADPDGYPIELLQRRPEP